VESLAPRLTGQSVAIKLEPRRDRRERRDTARQLPTHPLPSSSTLLTLTSVPSVQMGFAKAVSPVWGLGFRICQGGLPALGFRIEGLRAGVSQSARPLPKASHPPRPFRHSSQLTQTVPPRTLSARKRGLDRVRVEKEGAGGRRRDRQLREASRDLERAPTTPNGGRSRAWGEGGQGREPTTPKGAGRQLLPVCMVHGVCCVECGV